MATETNGDRHAVIPTDEVIRVYGTGEVKIHAPRDVIKALPTLRNFRRFLLILLGLNFGQPVSAESDLRYIVELFSGAVSAQATAPGAGGTQAGFLLEHRKGTWSRFNWPRFAPVPGLESLSFYAKAGQNAPDHIRVRLLDIDGVEWQGPVLVLAPHWQRHQLSAASFRHFRGGDSSRGDEPNMDRVVQFHVVPSSSGEGIGRFHIDEIRFHPNGPSYTAGNYERIPRLTPEDADFLRLRDLIGRWRFEREKLERNTNWASSWLEELIALRGEDLDARRRLAERRSPWQYPPPKPRSGPWPLEEEDYAAMIADYEARPVKALELTPSLTRVHASRLYQAPRPDPPQWRMEGDRHYLSMSIRFGEQRERQTVFFHIRPSEPVSVAGRVVTIRMRCPPGPLHPTHPLLLRLHSEGLEEGDSWADFSPEPMPGGEWQDIRFDTNTPLRSIRFRPESVTGFSIRLENQPGRKRDFELAVTDLRLDWPTASSSLRQDLLQAEYRKIHQARRNLYELRNQIAIEEDELARESELWSDYLSSFQPKTRSSHPPSEAFLWNEKSVAGLHGIGRDPFRWRSIRDPAGVALHVEIDPELAAVRLSARFSVEGTVVASLTGETAEPLSLPLPPSAVWSIRRPVEGTLEMWAEKADGRTIRAEVPFSPGIVNVGPAPLNPTLRHLHQRRQPDWTMYENGRPWFPRMTRYSGFDGGVEATRLFDDLWVDGPRGYGFDQNQTVWRQLDERGVPGLHPMSPNFRHLRDWRDIPVFREHYRALYQLLGPQAGRPFQAVLQAGNEVELSLWGASLARAFPDALYQPLDLGAELLGTEYAQRSPVMYVRAGHFRDVPPLPHEDMVGVNQYTGRYGGRIDEVPRNLAELAREALFSDRPMFIGEWMGPKYSWAGTGIGGVSRKGAAYYLERYWRAMIDTPGIVGSSQFTLNWVIAPFEDLTNQTREEAWQGRPGHTPFGGGRTADHIPLIPPEEAHRGLTFASMQGFHGPIYLLSRVTGPVAILHGPHDQRGAEDLARAMVQLGQSIDLVDRSVEGWQDTDGHWLLLLHPEDPPLEEASDYGILEPAADATEPLIRHLLFPSDPQRLLIHLSSPHAEAHRRGMRRLLDSTRALAELRAREGAMSRILALCDSDNEPIYRNYILEFAARGLSFSGDDTRPKLKREEFFDQAGQLRPAWEVLGAVLVDTTRKLEAGEISLLDDFRARGIHLILSLPAWQANPELRERYPAEIGHAHSMGDDFSIIPEMTQPLELNRLGGADLRAIRRFRPDLADSPSLYFHSISAPGSQTLASAANGDAVAVAWRDQPGQVVLIGAAFSETARVHNLVTRSGKTHPLYDRDTANGLERLSFFIINAGRKGWPEKEFRPYANVRVIPSSTIYPRGETVRAEIHLNDVGGSPLRHGQVRVRSRQVTGGRPGPPSAYFELPEIRPGVFLLECPPTAENVNGLSYRPPSGDTGDRLLEILSFQIKAHAFGHIPVDTALAVVLSD